MVPVLESLRAMLSPEYHGPPSLDRAYARVRRAKNHLTNLKRQITRFLNSPPGVLTVVGPERLYHDLAIREYDRSDIPEIISILVGETVYNLRAALDYLVYELSLLDSAGKVVETTPQFIIEDTPRGWANNKSRLKFLTPGHRAAIKKLQPTCGCNWTGRLRDLSNPDKHRDLCAVRHIDTIKYSGTFSLRRDDSVDRQITIAFSDGSPVVEALQELHANVTDVLDGFNPEFPWPKARSAMTEAEKKAVRPSTKTIEEMERALDHRNASPESG